MKIAKKFPEYYRDRYDSLSDVKSYGLISDNDLRWLLTLTEFQDGNILEIGTNLGHTTKALAEHFPNRIVYTIDCVRSSSPINFYQRNETPTWERVCMAARDLPNVVYMNGLSQQIPFPNNLGVIFIDGGHEIHSVQSDSLKALRSNASLIIWHDAVRNPNHPWIDVPEYLENISNVHYIEGTNLACKLAYE